VSEYASAAGKKGGKMDALPETKERSNYARDSKNKDGLVSKWQHAAKKGSIKQVDDGSGNGTTARPCNKQESCITCNVARRTQGSDKCNACALAVMAAFFGT
jgi:hypothetical protein